MSNAIADPLQALVQLSAKLSLFPPNSRYYAIETTTLKTSDGKTIPFLRRRFVPSPSHYAIVQEYSVTQGDRLDNLSNRFLGDPEVFWQLCDSNCAMRPEELTETVGRTIQIGSPKAPGVA